MHKSTEKLTQMEDAHELFISNSIKESLRWVPLPSHELQSYIDFLKTVASAAVFSWEVM